MEKVEEEHWDYLVKSDDENQMDSCSMFRYATANFKMDPTTCYQYIKMAADNGLEEALVELANFYYYFNNDNFPIDKSIVGILPDRELALNYLERAATLWDSDKTYIMLSEFCKGLNRNEDVIKWLKIPSERGNQEATLLLGRFYMLTKQYDNAKVIFEKK